MRHAAALLVAFFCLPSILGAVEVDREELESSITEDVVFENYEGPPQTDTDTAEAIRGIGAALARGGLEPAARADYFDRYRVIHAVDPLTSEGLDADIFIILEEAEVNHIENVRRILASYLQGAYEYSRRDAATLAEFITLYNAIYRGDMEFFEGRYKQVVIGHVSAENVGISTLYSDWPGATRMVIPLSPDAAPGELGAVDTLQLADDEVTERLREQEEDQGIEEREQIVDLMEREAEQREERVEAEREEIADEREAIAREEEALEEEKEALEEEREATPPADEAAQEELDRREEELEKREEDLEDRQEDLEEREEEVEREEERVDALEETSREQRAEIAEDRREELGEEPQASAAEEEPLPLFFVRVRYEDGEPVGQPIIIDARTGDELRRSEVRSVTARGYERLDGDALVVADYEGLSRLLLVDGETTEPTALSEERVYATSTLRVRGRNEIYAVVEVEGSWRVGRFDGALDLQAYSAEAVEPATYIEIAEGKIWVQNRTGSIVGLTLEEL